MKNHLVKFTSNDDERDKWGEPVFVSAFAVQGITPGDHLYASDNDPEARRTSGTGEQSIGRGAWVYFSGGYESVRQSVAEVEALFAAKLKELASR